MSNKFEAALRYACRCHQGQMRKGTRVPYISHPLTVASLVLEFGGSETQAIAALLHDVIEDCGINEREIKKRFGRKIARIVVECSDYFGPKAAHKPDWKSRKEKYLARLSKAQEETLLVSAADKLHNARSIKHGAERHGASFWKRFSAPPSEILWYYESLVASFSRRRSPGLKNVVDELEVAVIEMREVVPK